jgi:hypothetical protein
VAGAAFIAAGAGFIVNQFFTGWMAVGGMCGVGLLYIGIGVYHLTVDHQHVYDEAAHGRTAEQENFVNPPHPELAASDDDVSPQETVATATGEKGERVLDHSLAGSR